MQPQCLTYKIHQISSFTISHCHSCVVSAMRSVAKRSRLESCGFCYKVALYLSYLPIKFDDEIKRESLQI